MESTLTSSTHTFSWYCHIYKKHTIDTGICEACIYIFPSRNNLASSQQPQYCLSDVFWTQHFCWRKIRNMAQREISFPYTTAAHISERKNFLKFFSTHTLWGFLAENYLVQSGKLAWTLYLRSRKLFCLHPMLYFYVFYIFYIFLCFKLSFAKSSLVWFVKTFGSNVHASPKTKGLLYRCKPYLNKPKNMLFLF